MESQRALSFAEFFTGDKEVKEGRSCMNRVGCFYRRPQGSRRRGWMDGPVGRAEDSRSVRGVGFGGLRLLLVA